MKKMEFLPFVMIFVVFASATMSFADEAVFYPSTGRVSIPQLIVAEDPPQTVFSVDLQQRSGTWVFDLSNVVLAPTAPDKFTSEWMAGKTLYQVWHGNGIRNGVTLESVPVVVKRYFSENGIVVTQGLFNNDITHAVASYAVSINGGLSIADGDESLIHEIVCGSTDRYIKTHSRNLFGGFNNVNLFFFDKNDALSAAEFLSNDPPMCPTAP